MRSPLLPAVRNRAASGVITAIALTHVLAAPASAQCTTDWATVPTGLSGVVNAVAYWDPDGDGPQHARTVVGGSFTTSPGSGTVHLASWDGSAWSTMNPGIGSVIALAVLPGGQLIAGSGLGIAKFDGGSWSLIGPGMQAYCLAVLPNGAIAAGGKLTDPLGSTYPAVGILTGSTWLLLGAVTTPPLFGEVLTICATADGGLIAGGLFSDIGGVPATNIARWSPVSGWSALGSGLGQPSVSRVSALTARPDGTIVAGAQGGTATPFQPFIAEWNSASWAPLGLGLAGLGSVSTLLTLPDGDVLAAGLFSTAGGSPVGNIARWNGASWSKFGAPSSTGTNGGISDVAMLPDGRAAVVGSFTAVDGMPSMLLAYLVPSCQPIVFPSGGCPSSGGINLLVPLTLPWVDAMFRARGVGLPQTAIVVAATSVTQLLPAVALSSIHPLGRSNCTLSVAPDILQAIVTTNGTADSELFLVNSPPLVGVTFYHQMVPIEIDPLGNWVEITSTNMLRLTAGDF